MVSDDQRNIVLTPGTVIAGYRVERALGHGGMAIVYEATQLSLNRTVALKVIAGHLGDDPIFRERFRREGMLQGALDHPHIVTVHEAGETPHGLFLAMRLVRGPRLKDLILMRELDAQRTVRLLGPVADALDSAHEAGLIHRDVKPQNILVGGRDHAFLADFGLTKLPGEKSLTGSGHFIGTLDYVAPEQIVGERPTTASDIYALGAVVYECLTGLVPFPRETDAAVLYGHISDPPPRPSDRQEDLPKELDGVIAKAMAKDPGERHETGVELIEDVERSFGSRVKPIRPLYPARTAPEAATLQPDEVATRALAPGGPTVPLAPPGEEREPVTPLSEPQAPPPKHRRSVVFLALAGIAIAAAGALVGALTGSGAAATHATAHASAGQVAVSVPRGWSIAPARNEAAGINFREPGEITLDGHANKQGMVFGMVRPSGPRLLPESFVQTLPFVPERPDRVRLGAVDAQRYRGLPTSDGRRRLTVYAVPTSSGTATFVCFAPARASKSFFDSCEGAATTLRLAGVTAYTLEPSRRYAASVDRIFKNINSPRRADRVRMREAKSAGHQARIAHDLASRYRRAAASIRRIKAPEAVRAANAAVAGSLVAAAKSYDRLAAAILARDPNRDRAAANEIRANETQVQRWLDSLRPLGYEIH